jgi:hypothetical protein
MSAREDTAFEITHIGDLGRGELVAHWTRIYRCPPPLGVRRDLLRYAVAWELQTKRFGGLSVEARKALKAAVANVGTRLARTGQCETVVAASDEGDPPVNSEKASGKAAARRTDIQTGARLIREWNGRTNVVDVVQGGFLFEGKSYRSLSAIARKITDAHWSGPRFFGL